MKQSGHLNHSEETETGCPVTSKYGRTPPNKHGGVGQQQQQQQPTPALCELSVRTVVKLCTLGVFALGVSLVS